MDPLMDSLRNPYGLSKDLLWTPVWTPYGPPMDSRWTRSLTNRANQLYGPSMDLLWTSSMEPHMDPGDLAKIFFAAGDHNLAILV